MGRYDGAGWVKRVGEEGSRVILAGMPIFCYFLFFRYLWPDPFSIFSYFIFVFLNFLSLFVFIFCETAGTHRFLVIFAKVQWHPCIG